jgi:cyclophilin family peptidyl-prolyl cis-trans isomerase
MANSGRDRNGSQFFITYAATPTQQPAHHLGLVTSGMDVAQSSRRAIHLKPQRPARGQNQLDHHRREINQ